MTQDPEVFAAIGGATSPSFSRDGRTLFHLRGSGLPQVWALDLASGDDRQSPSTTRRWRCCDARRSMIV